jgi:hypothetical protein
MQRKRPERLAFFKIQHNKSGLWKESYVTPESPNGFAGRCFPALCCRKQHKAFNLHHFRPYQFASGRQQFQGIQSAFHIPVKRARRVAAAANRYTDAT